jgi:hypothetical protein
MNYIAFWYFLPMLLFYSCYIVDAIDSKSLPVRLTFIHIVLGVIPIVNVLFAKNIHRLRSI